MKKHKILVTGGCGFVGTQTVYKLHELGHQITVVDRKVNDWSMPATKIEMDYCDYLERNSIQYDTIIHLAAEHIVPESFLNPEKYYRNNVIKMKGLLDQMVVLGIKNIIFSSTGNLYGRQGNQGFPLSESAYYDPQNPYASSKVAGELMIKDYTNTYGIKYINFRYFNACGADPKCRFGYIQRPATHVIPVICNKILKDEIFYIYGEDYDTVDGTCIRDYVHIDDLADAHIAALDFLDSGSASQTINLGGGSAGVSINDLVKYAGQIVGKEPKIEYADRRQGDPAILIADIFKAKMLLNWEPKYNVKDAILHAWNWEKKFEASK